MELTDMLRPRHALFLTVLIVGLTGCSDQFVTESGYSRSDVAGFDAGRLTKRFRAQTPNVIFFDFDRSNLDEAAKARLDKQAKWIGRYPEVMFALVGHTDKVGGDSYNETLGMRRAEAALDYLVSKGIERKRLVALTSKGETQPLVATEDRERRNRRVTTEVFGLLKGDDSKGSETRDSSVVVSVGAGTTSSDTSSPVQTASVTTTDVPSTTTSTTSTPAPASSPSTGDTNTSDTSTTTSTAPTSSEPSEPTTSDPTPDSGNVRPNNGKGNGSEGSELDPGRSGKTKAANND